MTTPLFESQQTQSSEGAQTLFEISTDWKLLAPRRDDHSSVWISTDSKLLAPRSDDHTSVWISTDLKLLAHLGLNLHRFKAHGTKEWLPQLCGMADLMH